MANFVSGAFLRAFDIHLRTPCNREERIEAMAEFIERANPRESIKIVTADEELDEVVEGLVRGLSRLEAKRKQRP